MPKNDKPDFTRDQAEWINKRIKMGTIRTVAALAISSLKTISDDDWRFAIDQYKDSAIKDHVEMGISAQDMVDAMESCRRAAQIGRIHTEKITKYQAKAKSSVGAFLQAMFGGAKN
jgi:hypothetical protein